jgi:hypothetical protein
MPAGTVVGQIIVTDETPEDTFTYEVFGLSFEGDQVSVPFTEQDGNLITTEVLYYNQINRYEVIIKVTDKTNLSFEKTVFVNVRGNSAPTKISISNPGFNDTIAIGSFIGKLTTSDPDAGDTFTYVFETNINTEIGKDNSKFLIKNDSLISNYDFSDFDGNECSLYIKSTDNRGKFVVKEIILNVNKALGFFPEESSDYIRIYPNPNNNGLFNVELDSKKDFLNEYYLVQIFNLQGELIKSIKGESFAGKLSIQLDQKGLYILRIKIGDSLINRRILFE